MFGSEVNMKFLKYFFVVLCTSFLFMGNVFAAVESETLSEVCESEDLTCDFTEKDTSGNRNIYVFRGDGCSYCQRLLTYLASIYDDYSDEVNIVIYEVTGNRDNMNLYEDVAAKFGDEVQGYPYMVIGEEVFNGYTSSYDSNIVAAIEDLISAETPYDVVEEVNSGNTDVVEEESNSTAVVITFIFAAVVIVLVFMGYRLKNIKK